MYKMRPESEMVIVESQDGIQAAVESMVSEPLPGFQISPKVPVSTALERLRASIEPLNPGFDFDDIQGPVCVKAASPHLDGGYVGRCAGLSLHENIGGFGEVCLQLVEKNIQDTWQVNSRSVVGPCLKGSLEPGIMTVFSNRIYSVPAKAIVLGASYHLFKLGDHSPARVWTRYSSTQILGI